MSPSVIIDALCASFGVDSSGGKDAVDSVLEVCPVVVMATVSEVVPTLRVDSGGETVLPSAVSKTVVAADVSAKKDVLILK